MKYLTSLLIFSFLLVAISTVGAQDLGKTLDPVVEVAVDASSELAFLPVKKVNLLHEVDASEEAAEVLDASADPEAEFEENSLDDETFNLQLLLQVFSVANIAQIHVKIGTQPGRADVAKNSFAFDGQKGLQAPFSYARDGKTIMLGMGQVKGINPYYAEVILESVSGQLSEPRYYSPE